MLETKTCLVCGIDAEKVLHPPSSLALESLSVTNRAPSPAQKNLVEESLIYLQDGIDAVDQAISVLRQKREHLIQRRAKQCAILIPVRRLPPELLLTIFKYCIDCWWEAGCGSDLGAGDYKRAEEATRYPQYNSPKWQIMPMHLLTHVCQSWRAIGRAQSSLWTNIYVKDSHCYSNSSLLQLTTQLELSHTQPLHVLLSPGIRGKVNSPLLESLYGCHSRWLSLRMVLMDHPHLPLPIVTTPLTLRLLRSLTIRLHPFRQASVKPILTLSATNVPALTEFTLICPKAQEYSVRSVDLPWEQLRKVIFRDCPPSQTSTYVAKMQQVEELNFSGECSNAQYPHAHLPCLRYLEITTPAPFTFGPHGTIIQHMRLPALKSLTWTRMRYEHGSDAVSMLQRSTPESPTFEELILVDPSVTLCSLLSGTTRTSFEEILASTGPGFRKLYIGYTIRDRRGWGEFFTILTRLIEGDTFPHQLSTLELHNVELDIPAFCRMLNLSLEKRDRFKLHVTGQEVYQYNSARSVEEQLDVLNRLRDLERIIHVTIDLSEGGRLHCSTEVEAKILDLREDSSMEETLEMLL